MIALVLAILCQTINASSAIPALHAKRNITVLGGVEHRSVALRVLPLGDSITNGVGSSDGNGYRHVFVELAEAGGPVTMIGSHNGTGVMPENEEEGWNGFTIDQISQKATNALKAKPNLVLLLAGTNNMNNASQAATAPAEMSNLLGKVIAGSPRAVVLVGTILPSTQPGRQSLNDQYNSALQQIVKDGQSTGKRVLLVPTGSAVDPDELVDGIHPNDAGYDKMAIAWIQGVNTAQDQGWFEAPEPGDGYVEPSSRASRLDTNGVLWWHCSLVLVTLIAKDMYDNTLRSNG
ncbi:uncharacterized protein PV09_06206 [Verruconis gallopava]|uniref:SGNH hydrolase-type esterase domain-containing protein n=1 Tax=Verruconis gallopava TaxID=253628 RepID=A0A0D1XJB2_9PEZI|nr:uncharacterized protein PV09_06206 [Verruconis gallopava]KIW02386.1 hypothetical protein PV09_06206 [Verruconis gallopava]